MTTIELQQPVVAGLMPIQLALYVTPEELAYLDCVSADNFMTRDMLVASMVREVIYDDIAEEKKSAQ